MLIYLIFKPIDQYGQERVVCPMKIPPTPLKKGGYKTPSPLFKGGYETLLSPLFKGGYETLLSPLFKGG